MGLQHVGTVPFEATVYDCVSDKYTARHFVALVTLKLHCTVRPVEFLALR